MPLYRLKTVASFEALTLADGNYAFVTNGKLTSMTKAEFEEKYEPAVPFVKQG